MGQQVFGDVPALVLGVDEIFLRHFHVGEEGLAERRLAGDQQDRPRLDAGRGHVEQQEGNAFMLLGLGIRAHEAKNPVGVVGVARPDLLAVDEIMVALVLGLCLQRSKVGAGARLRIALAPADFATRDLGQVFLLLRLIAVFQQRRAEHPDAETVEGRAAFHRAHFFAQDFRFVLGEAAAAEFLRPVRHGPAARGHALQPLLLRLVLELPVAAAPTAVFFVVRRRTHFGRAICLEPGACLAPEGFEIGHQVSPFCPSC